MGNRKRLRNMENRMRRSNIKNRGRKIFGDFSRILKEVWILKLGKCNKYLGE